MPFNDGKPLLGNDGPSTRPPGRIGRPRFSQSNPQGTIGYSRKFFCFAVPDCCNTFEMKPDFDAEVVAEAPEAHWLFVCPCFDADFKATDAGVEKEKFTVKCVEFCQANVDIFGENNTPVGNVKCELNPIQYCLWCDGKHKKVFGAYDSQGKEKYAVHLRHFWCCEDSIFVLQQVAQNLPHCRWWKQANWEIRSSDTDALATTASYRGHVWCCRPCAPVFPTDNFADVEIPPNTSSEDRSLLRGISFLMSTLMPITSDKI